MKSLIPYQVYLFDFDGIILESVAIKTKAFAALYRRYGTAVEEQVVKHHEANGGMNRYQKFRHYHKCFLNRELNPDELAEMSLKFSEISQKEILSAPLVPGVEHFFRTLPKTKPRFVVSATPHEELKKIVANRELGHWFSEVYGFPPLKEKCISQLVERCQVKKEEALFFGDAINDWQAARDSGVAFWGRTSPHVTFPAGTVTFSDFLEFA